MLIWSKPRSTPPAVGAVDFVLQVRPAVVFQDFRIEILDAEAEARHAELAQGFQLVLLERPRLALERHFLGAVPRQQRLEPLHQAAQLVGAEVRRRAAAEVDVFEPPAADDGFLAVDFDFLDEGVDVGFHVAGVLVGVDAEVTELAALPAERDVEVEAERRIRRRRCVEDGPRLGQEAGLPSRERRVVGDEVVAQAGLFLGRFGGHGRRLAGRRATVPAGGGPLFMVHRAVKQANSRRTAGRLDVILIILIKMEKALDRR